jgi:hypothetical protein
MGDEGQNNTVITDKSLEDLFKGTDTLDKKNILNINYIKIELQVTYTNDKTNDKKNFLLTYTYDEFKAKLLVKDIYIKSSEDSVTQLYNDSYDSQSVQFMIIVKKHIDYERHDSIDKINLIKEPLVIMNAQDGGKLKKGQKKKTLKKPVVSQNKENKYKEVLGKRMKIYKKPDSRKEYVKYKGELVPLVEYKKTMKEIVRAKNKKH